MKVWARVGDLVTCEKGHPIAHVLEDIVSSSKMKVSQFGWLRSDCVPKPGDEVSGCPECGADYVQTNQITGGARLHTREHGWTGCRHDP